MIVEFAWLGVDHAEAPKREVFPIDEGSSCIEADVRFSGDEGIGGKSRVFQRIRNHKNTFRIEDRVSAERKITISLFVRKSVSRLEPDPFFIHQRHKNDRNIQNKSG